MLDAIRMSRLGLWLNDCFWRKTAACDRRHGGEAAQVLSDFDNETEPRWSGLKLDKY